MRMAAAVTHGAEVSMHEEKHVDPRIRRTRLALQKALEGLLGSRDFESLSVGDIAEAAGVNRATFYDHYSDKFALLECMVATRFHDLLAARGVVFDGTCMNALRALILGVCDYLAAMPRLECARQRQLEPHLEAAVISVVRSMILDGIRCHRTEGEISPEMIATTVSWAIYGASKEWVRTSGRCPSTEIVDTVMELVGPMLPSYASSGLHAVE